MKFFTVAITVTLGFGFLLWRLHTMPINSPEEW
jgi:hypothetical protein